MKPTATARVLALTSVLGVSVAVVATILGHIGLGPGFNPLVLTVSDYALSDRGAVIEAAMIALAGGSLALLAGLTAARAPVRGVPTVLLLIWAAGLLIAAAVHTDPIGTPVMSTAAAVHRYASVAAFVCLPGAALVLASRFAAEAAWATLSRLLRRLAAASGVGLALLLYVAFPGDRVLMGLVERALIAVEIVVLLVLALRLLHLGVGPEGAGFRAKDQVVAQAGGGRFPPAVDVLRAGRLDVDVPSSVVPAGLHHVDGRVGTAGCGASPLRADPAQSRPRVRDVDAVQA